MRQLYIKQKVLNPSSKFSVKDELENEVYFVEGSFMQVPKTFSIMNVAGEEVTMITKKTFGSYRLFWSTYMVKKR